MKKGEIYWGRSNEPNNGHLLHPIVIMEDVNTRQKIPDKIKAVILSSKRAKDSSIENVEMNRFHFERMNDKKRFYKIRVNRKKKIYLVCFGYLKCPMSLHVHEKGKLTPNGLKFISDTLSAHNIKEYEYVPYTVKEHNELIKKQKHKKQQKL